MKLLIFLLVASNAMASSSLHVMSPNCKSSMLSAGFVISDSPTASHEATGKFMQYIKVAFETNHWLSLEDVKFFSGFVKVANPFEVFSSRIPSSYQEIFKSGVDEFIQDVDWGLAVEEMKKIIRQHENIGSLKAQAHEATRLVDAFIPVKLEVPKYSDQYTFDSLNSLELYSQEGVDGLMAYSTGVKIQPKSMPSEAALVKNRFGPENLLILQPGRNRPGPQQIFDGATGKWEGYVDVPVSAEYSAVFFYRNAKNVLTLVYEYKKGFYTVEVSDELPAHKPVNIITPFEEGKEIKKGSLPGSIKLENNSSRFILTSDNRVLVAFTTTNSAWMDRTMHTLYVLDLTNGGRLIYYQPIDEFVSIHSGIEDTNKTIYFHISKLSTKEHFLLDISTPEPKRSLFSFKSKLSNYAKKLKLPGTTHQYSRFTKMLVTPDGDLVYGYLDENGVSIVNASHQTENRILDGKSFSVNTNGIIRHEIIYDRNNKPYWIISDNFKRVIVVDLFEQRFTIISLGGQSPPYLMDYFGARWTQDNRLLAYFKSTDFQHPVCLQLYGPVDLSKVKAP